MSKVCVVGHVTSESIVVGGHRSDPTVGGTGFFSSFAYRKLGLDTTLVTKVAENDRADLLTKLEHAGVKIRCFPSAELCNLKISTPHPIQMFGYRISQNLQIR